MFNTQKSPLPKAVGTGGGGAKGHVPPQYLELPVVVPLQYFQEILELNFYLPYTHLLIALTKKGSHAY